MKKEKKKKIREQNKNEERMARMEEMLKEPADEIADDVVAGLFLMDGAAIRNISEVVSGELMAMEREAGAAMTGAERTDAIEGAAGLRKLELFLEAAKATAGMRAGA